MARIAEVSNFPFDILIDPTQPHPAQTPQDSPAAQHEEPCLASNTVDVVCDMFTSQAASTDDDDTIQLVMLAWTDPAGDTMTIEYA